LNDFISYYLPNNSFGSVLTFFLRRGCKLKSSMYGTHTHGYINKKTRNFKNTKLVAKLNINY